jgi:hypothetical protein
MCSHDKLKIPWPTQGNRNHHKLAGWLDDIIEFSTLGPGERRMKKARVKEEDDEGEYDDFSPAALKLAMKGAMKNKDKEEDDDLTPEAFNRAMKEADERRLPSNADKEEDDDLTPEAFKRAMKEADEMRLPSNADTATMDEAQKFDGYAFADLLTRKWGAPLDVDFRPVTSLGKTDLYVAVMPIPFGSKRCRHGQNEMAYLCHLQGVIEVLEKYGMLEDYVDFVETTDKKPRARTSPLIAVTWRMELTKNQVKEITGSG